MSSKLSRVILVGGDLIEDVCGELLGSPNSAERRKLGFLGGRAADGFLVGVNIPRAKKAFFSG